MMAINRQACAYLVERDMTKHRFEPALKAGNKKYFHGGLTTVGIMVHCRQQTHQASVFRDMLNVGGFLFFGRGA